MANKFQIKRTAVSGREANTSVIDVGELALNITDGIMYSTNGTVVFEIGSNLTNQAVSANSTANNITANNVTTGNLNVDYINFSTVSAPLVATANIELTLENGLLFTIDSDNVFRVVTSAIFPEANSTIDLGLSTKRWDQLYVDDVIVTANVSAVNLSGNGASVTSVNAAAVGGNTASTLRTYSETTAGTAYANAISRANHTGTQTLSTISDAGTIASQDSTNVNIDGGAIDNTPIGASTANTGTFSTLVASGLTYPTSDGSSGQVITTNGTGTLTFTTVAGGATNLTDSANSTTVTIASDTGTDAVLVGANSTTAGVLTAVTQTIGGDKTFSNNITVSAGKTISGNGVNITSVNAAAVGGNTASTLLSRANHTGTQTLSTISDAGTMASQDATSVNIDGGAIDNTPIGSSVANSGTFSSLVAGGLTYPTSDGTDGQVLTTNGLGTLSFQDAGGGVDLTAVASNIVPTANSTYDLGTTLKRWDELFVDDITVTANVTAAQFTETSSIRYKENIRDLDSIIVDSLRPVVFDKKDGSSKDEAGFIAEEVLKLDPSLVLMNENNEAEGIHYTRLIPHLVSYIQKLEQRVKELENG